jgi:hypothetical protein
VRAYIPPHPHSAKSFPQKTMAQAYAQRAERPGGAECFAVRRGRRRVGAARQMETGTRAGWVSAGSVCWVGGRACGGGDGGVMTMERNVVEMLQQLGLVGELGGALEHTHSKLAGTEPGRVSVALAAITAQLQD